MNLKDKEPKLLQEPDLTLDEKGIPILDDVIDADDSAFTTTPPSTAGLNLPRRDLLLEALRQQLKRELHQELQQLSAAIASDTVNAMRQSLEAGIRSQLEHKLEQRLDQLLERTLGDKISDWEPQR